MVHGTIRFLCYCCIVSAVLPAACGREKDHTGEIPKNERSIIRDILQSNNLKNTSANRNKVAIVGKRDSDTGKRAGISGIQIHDEIHKVPPSVSGLSDLAHIEITGSTDRPPMPAGLDYFKPVRSLRISDRTVDSSFNSAVTHLCPELLAINRCRFEGFPDHLFNVSNLRILNLSDDSLLELSPDIGKLKRLEDVYLQGNMLRKLPPSIMTIPQLTRVDIRDNLFDTFPAVLTSLKHLEDLNISGNNIRFLPESILALNGLFPRGGYPRIDYRLKINGNRICDPSPAVRAYLTKFAGDGWRKYQKCE